MKVWFNPKILNEGKGNNVYAHWSIDKKYTWKARRRRKRMNIWFNPEILNDNEGKGNMSMYTAGQQIRNIRWKPEEAEEGGCKFGPTPKYSMRAKVICSPLANRWELFAECKKEKKDESLVQPQNTQWGQDLCTLRVSDREAKTI
jgi:hypothetical protein